MEMTTIATIELIVGCFRMNVQFLQFIYFFDWGVEYHSLTPLFGSQDNGRNREGWVLSGIKDTAKEAHNKVSCLIL